NAFYEAQDQEIENRKTSGEPGGDITHALSVIRRVLPPLPETGPLSEWLSQTIAILESEQQNYRQQEEDLTGCGSATFGELLTRLISLEPTLAMTY
ncbi:MAG: hypothetical protein VST69_01600, partial [Nitrospirota bacterium]|nr:hypothetical protein [Nitrospirota bacterium]